MFLNYFLLGIIWFYYSNKKICNLRYNNRPIIRITLNLCFSNDTLHIWNSSHIECIWKLHLLVFICMQNVANIQHNSWLHVLNKILHYCTDLSCMRKYCLHYYLFQMQFILVFIFPAHFLLFASELVCKDENESLSM